MGEREADLAIVAGPSGRISTGCRGGRQERGRASRKDRQQVMVLSEQHRLKEYCKNAQQRGPASRSPQPLLVRPDLCR
jgi:hypothetical protein